MEGVCVAQTVPKDAQKRDELLDGLVDKLGTAKHQMLRRTSLRI